MPTQTPEWDPEYLGPGMWRESPVKVWWDRLMKTDAAVDLSRLPDRDSAKARAVSRAWQQANEEFKREVRGMKPVDLSALCVETARERERARAKEDLVKCGVPEGCGEWQEALDAADERAKEMGQKEIEEARAWRDEALARDAEVMCCLCR